MRYYFEKPAVYSVTKGLTHTCDHPVYDSATLYLEGELGLCVIQQRFDPKSKHTYWSEIDPWMVDLLYMHPSFSVIFECYADLPRNGCYPTLTIRQLMYALKLKPLPKEPWETVFDRKLV